MPSTVLIELAEQVLPQHRSLAVITLVYDTAWLESRLKPLCDAIHDGSITCGADRLLAIGQLGELFVPGIYLSANGNNPQAGFPGLAEQYATEIARGTRPPTDGLQTSLLLPNYRGVACSYNTYRRLVSYTRVYEGIAVLSESARAATLEVTASLQDSLAAWRSLIQTIMPGNISAGRWRRMASRASTASGNRMYGVQNHGRGSLGTDDYNLTERARLLLTTFLSNQTRFVDPTGQLIPTMIEGLAASGLDVKQVYAKLFARRMAEMAMQS